MHLAVVMRDVLWRTEESFLAFPVEFVGVGPVKFAMVCGPGEATVEVSRKK